MNNLKEYIIIICENSDWEILEYLSNTIINKLNSKLLKKLNGLEQAYYDFSIDNNKFTLHLEHFLGISIFFEKEDIKDETKIQEIIRCCRNII